MYVYPTMANNAALSALLVVTALASAFASASGAGAGGRRYLRSGDANVIAICDRASFPMMCRSLVPTLSHPITAASLTEAAVKKAMAKGEEAKIAAKKYVASPETTKEVRGALRVCYKSFDTSVARLKEAARLLNERGLHEKVMGMLQGALAILADCDDAFNEFPWARSPVSHITKHLEKLTSNSLSLAIGVY